MRISPPILIDTRWASRNLSEMLSRVLFANHRFLVHRRGRPAAAIVSVEDLADLEQLKIKNTRPPGAAAEKENKP